MLGLMTLKFKNLCLSKTDFCNEMIEEYEFPHQRTMQYYDFLFYKTN